MVLLTILFLPYLFGGLKFNTPILVQILSDPKDMTNIYIYNMYIYIYFTKEVSFGLRREVCESV